MSRENNHTQRDRRTDMHKTDAASNNNRSSRNDKDQRNSPSRDNKPAAVSNLNGMDRNRLNDLYERSSI